MDYKLIVYKRIKNLGNYESEHLEMSAEVYIDTQKSKGTPVQLARSRTAAKAAKLVYKELVKELCK